MFAVACGANTSYIKQLAAAKELNNATMNVNQSSVDSLLKVIVYYNVHYIVYYIVHYIVYCIVNYNVHYIVYYIVRYIVHYIVRLVTSQQLKWCENGIQSKMFPQSLLTQ